MKKIFFSMVTFMLIVSSSFAQNANGDKVIGVWLSEKKDARIEIFKTDDKYFGKLIWGKEIYDTDGKTLLKDTKNPDAKLRTRTRLNIVLIYDLKYNDEAYIDGHLYDARSGRPYSLKMKLKDDNNLEMRGYYGVSLFGQTMEWARVK
jgi:uncharacterized protein (DUF2147 family)